VAGNHGPPGTDIVDVALVIGIVQAGTFAPGKEYRVTANALEGPYRRIHPAGYVLAGRLKQFV
jgi:hypothetical protein